MPTAAPDPFRWSSASRPLRIRGHPVRRISMEKSACGRPPEPPSRCSERSIQTPLWSSAASCRNEQAAGREWCSATAGAGSTRMQYAVLQVPCRAAAARAANGQRFTWNNRERVSASRARTTRRGGELPSIWTGGGSVPDSEAAHGFRPLDYSDPAPLLFSARRSSLTRRLKNLRQFEGW